MNLIRSNIIRSTCNSIHINVAFEQYLFKEAIVGAPQLFLWSNDRNVVIGRHQNPWKECHMDRMLADEVKLCRRNSGGGAVYQDLGNHCFTFLNPVTATDDFKAQNNHLLLNALKQFDIIGEASGRNDIHVLGRKVSGSAYQLSLGNKTNPKRVALHHGTMLVSCNFDNVAKYLNPNKMKLKSKGVDSVVQRVLNLQEIRPSLTTNLWEQALADEFRKSHGSDLTEIIVNEKDMLSIPKVQSTYEELISNKWLFLDIPEFTNQIEERFDWGIIDLYLDVKQGIITKGVVFSDCLYPEFITQLAETISSGKYSYTHQGIKDLCKTVRDVFSQNEVYLKYVDDLEKWILKVM